MPAGNYRTERLPTGNGAAARSGRYLELAASAADSVSSELAGVVTGHFASTTRARPPRGVVHDSHAVCGTDRPT